MFPAYTKREQIRKQNEDDKLPIKKDLDWLSNPSYSGETRNENKIPSKPNLDFADNYITLGSNDEKSRQTSERAQKNKIHNPLNKLELGENCITIESSDEQPTQTTEGASKKKLKKKKLPNSDLEENTILIESSDDEQPTQSSERTPKYKTKKNKILNLNLEEKNILIESSDDEQPTQTTEKALNKRVRKRKRASKKDKRIRDNSPEPDKDEIINTPSYFEDKRREPGYMKINTLPRKHIALYKKKKGVFFGNNLGSRKKKKPINRYYKFNLDPKTEEVIEEEKNTKKHTPEEIKRTADLDENELDDCLKNEQELSKKTETFNKILNSEPNNIDKWLEYITFQDTISQFEKTYKSTGSKGHRLTTIRKLSILDKALELNPESNRLLREKYFLSDEIYPADKIADELQILLQKRPLNLMLWKNLIDVKQSSVGQCTTSTVLELYDKAMTALNKARKGLTSSIVTETEDKIIQLVYQSGLFLRQTGLWEQFWTILRMYLDLNIVHSDNKHFNIFVDINEDKLRKSEDEILDSKLPLSVIWYRTERLREGVHWLPCKTETEDPQRVVFNEDVSMLLHPITSETLSFKLITIIISLMKVPLLPMRHTVCHHLGLFQPLWAIDSVELFLASSFSNIGLVTWNCENFFTNILELVSGAQYLDNSKLGQEEYLKFVIQLMHNCASHLQNEKRTAILIWWLRFERFLYTLHRYNIIKLPSNNKINKTIKDFLKQEPNRNVILFYREYALIEVEMGKMDSAIKILLTTIQNQSNINLILNRQADLCNLYRTLCQLLIGQNEIDQATSLLMTMVLGQTPNLSKTFSKTEIIQCQKKFHHISTEILSDLKQKTENELKLETFEYFLPNYSTEWFSCHAWFLFLTENSVAAKEFLKETLIKLPSDKSDNEEQTSTSIQFRQEILYETLISIVHWNCHNIYGSYGELESVLQEALALFPNNGFFLSTLANIETTSGCIARPWWQLSRYFYKTESSLAKLFILFLVRQRKMQLDEASLESYKTLNLGGPVIPDHSQTNRLGAMLSSLLENPITRRCPIFWRVYIQFLYFNDKAQGCDKAFFRAIDQCPWVKAIYLDGAKFVPNEIGQIQDLLIEKELRLHVTPEELDILQEGFHNQESTSKTLEDKTKK